MDLRVAINNIWFTEPLFSIQRWIDYHSFEVSAIAITILAGALVLLHIIDPEKPVEYDVSAPKECSRGWKGEVLREPSIKV